MRRCAVPLVLLALGFQIGCGFSDSTRIEPEHAAFEQVWNTVRTVELEEPRDQVIANIIDVKIGPRGEFVVVDHLLDRVRVHAPDGSLDRIVGRFGSGPGEFDNPRGALMLQNGGLVVGEAGQPRLSFFDADGSVEETVLLPSHHIFELHPLGRGYLAGLETGPEERYAIVSRDGEVRRRIFHRDPGTFEIPYWISFNWERAAVAGDSVFIATNFLYPVHIYDQEGDSLGSVGSPPSSWIPPSRPERGEFVGPSGMTRMLEWLRSFTVIDDVEAYGDSLLLVMHARFDPTVNDFYARNQYAMDVYTLDGAKRYEDVPVPGRVLYADRYLYVLLDTPPSPWTIGVFEWAGKDESPPTRPETPAP